ncbi:MAG: DoxX family protein [Gemmatimonadota bacterium]
MIESSRPTHGALLGMRIVTAAVFLWHGVPKAIDFPAAMDKFAGFGLPGILGPVVGWVEVIAAAALLVGVVHRPATLILAAVILGALVTVQIPAGVSPGLERDLVLLFALILLCATGPGRYRVRHPDRLQFPWLAWGTPPPDLEEKSPLARLEAQTELLTNVRIIT